jgi:hypothetical protein
MNKLITALILSVTAITAQAADYQEVFEYKGSASQIIAAANKAFGAVKTKSVSGDTLTVQTAVDCDKGWLGKVTVYGDIIVEAKDGRYRITFDNMKADTGYTLAQLPQNKEACTNSFKQFSQQINKKMGSFTDF